MRLSTAQDLSFQDLPYICLPLFAQAEVEHYFNGRFSCNEISNVNQFISTMAPSLAPEQLDSLISKIGDGWIFLVYSVTDDLPAEPLISLQTNLNVEKNRRGLEVEHWVTHPALRGAAKFSAELLIQRLTYHERVYGVTHVHHETNVGEHQWHAQKTQVLS